MKNRISKPDSTKTKKEDPRQPKGGVDEPQTTLSRRRLWLFRIIALLLAPVLLIGGAEIVLRLAHFGYPTSFMVKSRIDNEDYLITNEQFGFLFFPRGIARTPIPARMLAKKPPGTYRIFVFGESAALGDPDPSFGVGRYLQVLLETRYPGTKFEVINAAMTAINSHALLPMAREMANYEGDCWIIYMGNNEMIGPYGASTVFGARAPPVLLARASLALRSTRIGQLIESLLSKGSAAPATWGGMKMFKEHELDVEDRSRLKAAENFFANLEDMLGVATDHKIPVLLSTVACNLKDCPPFASHHKRNLTPGESAEWQTTFDAGKAFMKQGRDKDALDAFAKAAGIDPNFAEVHYRRGLILLKTGDESGAKVAFERARDDDALGFRANSTLNTFVKVNADSRRNPGVRLVDSDLQFAAESINHIPGHEWFYEHVHFNFEGNYFLAGLFADALEGKLPAPIKSKATPAWASQSECESRLAATLWDKYRVWQLNYSRVSEPPFTEQMNDAERARMYMTTLRELQSRMDGQAKEQARNTYQQAVQARPDDNILHANFSQFLEATGDLPASQREQESAHKLLPDFPGPLHKIGVLLVRQGKVTEATNYFAAALKLRPDYVPSLCELGTALANKQEFTAAEQAFAKAEVLNPGYVETYLSRGFMRKAMGKTDQAMEDYHRAANFQQDGPAAYFERGVTLASAHQRADAVKAFQAATFMNPGFWQARYLLGVELAADEKLEEASAQFKEVIRLRPDLAKAHFNLGVAYGKQRNIEDALKEFQTTIQLSPTNEAAKKYVETLEQLKNRKPPRP